MHLVAGPNGAGKSTFISEVLEPTVRLPAINADEIARRRWPGDVEAHGHAAAREAARQRAGYLARRESFITETVFSHRSKVELVEAAIGAGYLVYLHVIMIPRTLPGLRVEYRVAQGGHSVPAAKLLPRFDRLWPLVGRAALAADFAIFYDNSQAKTPFRKVAECQQGLIIGDAAWPAWTPGALPVSLSTTTPSEESL